MRDIVNDRKANTTDFDRPLLRQAFALGLPQVDDKADRRGNDGFRWQYPEKPGLDPAANGAGGACPKQFIAVANQRTVITDQFAAISHEGQCKRGFA